MLFQSFLDDSNSVLKAVGRAGNGFGSGSETREPETTLPELRPFQACMKDTLRDERRKGTRRGTIVAATGSGKTRLMTEDGLESQEEGGHRKPLLAIAPSIYLVYQLATSFALTERAKLNGSSMTRADDITTWCVRTRSDRRRPCSGPSRTTKCWPSCCATTRATWGTAGSSRPSKEPGAFGTR
jgi:hypothetical protein